MDQDDRHDGNTNSTENTAPRTQDNPSAYQLIRDFSGQPENPTPMTHTRINVATQSDRPPIESAEINTPEPITVGPEVEPATTAYATESTATPAAAPASPQVAKDSSGGQADVHPLSQVDQAPAIAPVAAKSQSKKRLLIIGTAILLAGVIGALAWWFLLGGNKGESVADSTDSMLSSSTQQPKLGITLTVADATVQHSVDGIEWQVATKETTLKEGDSIRTGTDSRAVLTLDDGSAIRLDGNSSVKLVSLSVDDVRIEQIEGSVYSRVVPSERTYTVSIDQTTYEALGTAFITVKNQSENGVQVYQSSVKTNDSEESVSEGKQYYKNSSDASIQGKLTDIDIDALVDNAFINWNLSQDEGDNNFKEKLGILAKIKERSAEKEVERLAAEEQKEKAEAAAKAALEKKQNEQKEKEKTHTENKEKVTRGEMKLNRSGKTFTWTYTGKAVHGYKLVYAKKASDAYFGNKNSVSVYYSNINDMSGQLSKSDTLDGDYFVRVCAYTAGTEGEACVDHSNVKEIEF